MACAIEIAPRDLQQSSIPASAFRIPRRVWIASQFFRAATPARTELNEADEEAGEGELETLGVFTVPDLANKRAGQAALSFKDERLSKWGHDRIKRVENKSEMWRLLQKLDAEGELFDQEVVTDDGGIGRVWVEEIGVEGPRN